MLKRQRAQAVFYQQREVPSVQEINPAPPQDSPSEVTR